MGRPGSGTTTDTYRHLNKDDRVPFDIEATAKTVCSLNYGLHRFLSAVVRINAGRAGSDPLVGELCRLLEEGYS